MVRHVNVKRIQAKRSVHLRQLTSHGQSTTFSKGLRPSGKRGLYAFYHCQEKFERLRGCSIAVRHAQFITRQTDPEPGPFPTLRRTGRLWARRRQMPYHVVGLPAMWNLSRAEKRKLDEPSAGRAALHAGRRANDQRIGCAIFPPFSLGILQSYR